MRHAYISNIFKITLGIVLILANTPNLNAEETSDIVDMITGDVQSVPADNVVRVSVTNPDIADISDAQSNKITLIAKKAGETALFIWDAAGKHGIKIRVVNEELGAVKARVQKILNEANLAGVTLEENADIGKVVISGSLPKDDKDRLDDVIEPYSDSLLNLVKEEKIEDLIQVDMQVIEINTDLYKNIGIEWGNTSGTGGNTATGSSTAAGTFALNYGENQPLQSSKSNPFRINGFSRNSPLDITVNALLQSGKARLISKPRLVVVSGKQASFLVGGEIPIKTSTLSNTGQNLTQSTSYAEYGVNMTVTPTIRQGKIDVLLNVDIRDIDNATPIKGTDGNSIAFTTRTASTNLFMDNKQTVVLAGLIKHAEATKLNEVPFLSKIPIFGAAFRSRANGNPDTNTEMVIILTPTILTEKKYATHQIVMPTPLERQSASDVDAKYEHEPLPAWPVAKPATVVPPVIVTAPTADIVTDMTSYARMVQSKISKEIAYPKAAIDASASGTVKLKLNILKDGSLNSVEVLESSGNTVLDQDALSAAKKAAPYAVFSSGMDQQDLIFMIPIVYNKAISSTK